MKELKKIFKFMEGHKLEYCLAIISMLVSLTAYTLMPTVLRSSIDNVFLNKPVESGRLLKLFNFMGGQQHIRENIYLIAFVVVGIIGVRGLFLFLQKKLAAKAVEATIKNIRDSLYDHIQRLPYDYHVKSDTGDLLQRASSDVDSLRKFLFIQFLDLIACGFIILRVLLIIFKMNKKMVLASVAILPILLAYSLRFFKKMKLIFKEREEKESLMTSCLQENINGVRVVKAFNRQDYELERFKKSVGEHRDINYRVTNELAKYHSLADLLCMSQIFSVILIGIYLSYKGEISLGEYSAFTVYVNMLVWPIRQLGRVLTDSGQAIVAEERISEILAKPVEVFKENFEEPEIKGGIEFENVSFSYDGREDILKDISFKIEPGESLALIGATGSGKTSLVQLIPRLYDYGDGSIKIDGRELRTIDKAWIRQNVGLVLQESFLYAKTIKENISFIDPNFSDERVYGAAKIASIHDDILSFEESYETMVGEKGVSLSGGQKQRMAIARMIIDEKPIIIFDDSLSAVDTETDSYIRESLKRKDKKSTSLIISHRISTVAEADKILVLEDGRIVESGSHRELMEIKGRYKKIFDIQNSIDNGN